MKLNCTSRHPVPRIPLRALLNFADCRYAAVYNGQMYRRYACVGLSSDTMPCVAPNPVEPGATHGPQTVRVPLVILCQSRTAIKISTMPLPMLI